MKSDDPFNQRLLKSIEQLPHDVFNYTKLQVIDIDLFSDKAVCLVFNLDNERRSRWIPYSQLKKDNKENVWITNWLFTKIRSDRRND